MDALTQWFEQHQVKIVQQLDDRLGQAQETAIAIAEILAKPNGDKWVSLQAALEGWSKKLPIKQSSMLYVSLLLEIQSDLMGLMQKESSAADCFALSNDLHQLFTPIFIAAANWESEQKTLQLQIELEKVKRDKQRLEKHKADFIAVAAHELKTPLTLIEGYANMLKNDLSPEEQPRAETMLRGIISGTGRLREIIEDMITLTMIEMGVMEYNPQPLSLGSLLEILVTDVRKVAEERKISLTIDDGSFDEGQVAVDPERVYEVFVKLLENAIKYTPDGGRIVISGHSEGEYTEVRIKDSGIGIDEPDQNIIFEKFFSLGAVGLHSSSKSKFKGGGPGLGLAIARGIVEAHHGKVWAESAGHDETQLHGSTFIVRLPVAKSADSDQYNSQLPESVTMAYALGNA